MNTLRDSTGHRPIRVLYDGESFFRHARGGIPRYLAQLIREFRTDPQLGVEAITPYRWVASRHLAELRMGHLEVPMPRRFRYPTLRRLNERRLGAVRAAGGVDIVHHSLYEPATFDYWPGRKRVTTVYDFMLDRFPEHLTPGDDHPQKLAGAMHGSDAVICISQATADDLFRFHPDFPRPVHVVPLGVGDSFFAPAKVRLPRLPAKYLLFVGNRMEHKNIDLLLEMFAELAPSDPDLHLVLVGAPGPTETARLQELGIADRTVRLRVSDAQLPWIYRGAEALVYTTKWEGFGLPVVEAMASGCPTVIADVAALVEVGADAALLFPVGDRGTLLKQVEHVLSDPGEADRLRKAGLERARDFTWHRTAELTADVYASLVAD